MKKAVGLINNNGRRGKRLPILWDSINKEILVYKNQWFFPLATATSLAEAKQLTALIYNDSSWNFTVCEVTE